MLSYDEILGYFNMETDHAGILLGKGIYIYPCLVCSGLVLSEEVEKHILWHKGKKDLSREQTPDEIVAQARRERYK